jgi:hypothetical protein
VRSRRRRAAAVAWLLAVAALAAPVAMAQPVADVSDSSGFVIESERFTPSGGEPVDLRFMITSDRLSQRARLVNATHEALTRMSEWFGPPRTRRLTVAGVVCRAHTQSGVPPGAGLVSACLHWLAPIRDQQTERELIAGITREYWLGDGVPAGNFAQSLISYTANRAIHQQLGGSNFATMRFLGGYVPFPLRSVLLSPPVNDLKPRVLEFDWLDASRNLATLRGMRALQSLERYVGWPTMLETLSRLRQEGPRSWNAPALANILSEIRGTDMRVLVSECFRDRAVFDYAIDDVQSRPAGGQVESTITIARRGDARFAASSDEGDRDAAIPVRIRFADGREIRERIDGSAPLVTLQYTAPVAAIVANVDPDVMLVLDADRDNNSFVRDAAISKLGVRLAMNWLAWLQNAMLSYTALL